MKTLYTGGTFDILHYGHMNFLKKCANIADRVIVALNTDDFILEYKGSKPVMDYNERKQSLLHCKYVTGVVENVGGGDSKPSILKVNPDIIAIGSDWAQKDYFKQMQFTEDWLSEHKITLVYISYTAGISTTDIKTRIANGLRQDR